MKKRLIPIILAVLIIATAAVAAWHLTTREQYESGGLTVQYGDQQIVLHAESLSLTQVTGETVNGKGETNAVDAQGIELAEALSSAGIDTAAIEGIEVVASDEYRAEVTGDELRESGKVYLILDSDGNFQMIVFGDANSKRNVRELVAIELQ